MAQNIFQLILDLSNCVLHSMLIGCLYVQVWSICLETQHLKLIVCLQTLQVKLPQAPVPTHPDQQW